MSIDGLRYCELPVDESTVMGMPTLLTMLVNLVSISLTVDFFFSMPPWLVKKTMWKPSSCLALSFLGTLSSQKTQSAAEVGKVLPEGRSLDELRRENKEERRIQNTQHTEKEREGEKERERDREIERER